MDDIYREQIIDHYKNPRNYGELKDADPPTHSTGSVQAGSGRVVRVKEANASCGDLFELTLKFEILNSKFEISAGRFNGVGCAISTAAMSMFTEQIESGKWKMDKLQRLKEKDMLEMLGIKVSPTRMKCVVLPIRALKKALKEASGKLTIEND